MHETWLQIIGPITVHCQAIAPWRPVRHSPSYTKDNTVFSFCKQTATVSKRRRVHRSCLQYFIKNKIAYTSPAWIMNNIRVYDELWPLIVLARADFWPIFRLNRACFDLIFSKQGRVRCHIFVSKTIWCDRCVGNFVFYPYPQIWTMNSAAFWNGGRLFQEGEIRSCLCIAGSVADSACMNAGSLQLL